MISKIIKCATVVSIMAWLFFDTAVAQAARPLAVRINWLEQRVKVHRFGCRHPQVKRSYWHCQVLHGWLLRELHEARAIQQRISVTHSLNLGLHNSPMAGTGQALEAAGRRWHISPFFIAAIAATESSLGAAACGNFNAYGLANCSGRWSVPLFRSWADSYQFMGHFLITHWPNARTTYDYHGYAACDSCWGRKTAEWMKSLFGVGPSVRYPNPSHLAL